MEGHLVKDRSMYSAGLMKYSNQNSAIGNTKLVYFQD
jgi:hypothetical protein